MDSTQIANDNWHFEKGKSITLNVQNTPVKITFAAQPNEKISDMIKSILLNNYSAKLC